MRTYITFRAKYEYQPSQFSYWNITQGDLRGLQVKLGLFKFLANEGAKLMDLLTRL